MTADSGFQNSSRQVLYRNALTQDTLRSTSSFFSVGFAFVNTLNLLLFFWFTKTSRRLKNGSWKERERERFEWTHRLGFRLMVLPLLRSWSEVPDGHEGIIRVNIIQTNRWKVTIITILVCFAPRETVSFDRLSNPEERHTTIGRDLQIVFAKKAWKQKNHEEGGG